MSLTNLGMTPVAFPFCAEESIAGALGSESGSPGIYYFRANPLRDEDSVTCVFASEVFTPTGFESIGG